MAIYDASKKFPFTFCSFSLFTVFINRHIRNYDHRNQTTPRVVVAMIINFFFPFNIYFAKKIYLWI
jgi:hypothetical protein